MLKHQSHINCDSIGMSIYTYRYMRQLNVTKLFIMIGAKLQCIWNGVIYGNT